MERLLQNKVALITGTGGGQGRAAALRFAEAGAHVIGCDTKIEGNAETVELVTAAGGSMTGMAPVDLGDPAEAARWVAEAVAVHGRMDILYNNASRAEFAPMGTFPPEQWQRGIRNELDLLFYATEAAWPHLIQSRGVIINTGSTAGMQGSGPGGACHAAAKGGVIALSIHWAREGAPFGIRSVCISPGYIETPGTAAVTANKQFHDALVASSLAKRGGTADDVANLAVYLASDLASFISGVNYPVDGGSLIAKIY